MGAPKSEGMHLYSIPNREGDEEKKFRRYLRLKTQSKKVLVFIGNAIKRRYKLPRNCNKPRTEIGAIEAIITIMADIIENNYYLGIIGYLTNCSWSWCYCVPYTSLVTYYMYF